jgi:hypothetical protein
MKVKNVFYVKKWKNKNKNMYWKIENKKKELLKRGNNSYQSRCSMWFGSYTDVCGGMKFIFCRYNDNSKTKIKMNIV